MTFADLAIYAPAVVAVIALGFAALCAVGALVWFILDMTALLVRGEADWSFVLPLLASVVASIIGLPMLGLHFLVAKLL